MNLIIKLLTKAGILKPDLDYHLLRALMVIICLFFGYQKWFDYEAQALIPYISHGPLIFWLYPVFGIRGATYFLGLSEWLFGALLFAGFWNKKLGILGALGMCFSMISTSTKRHTSPATAKAKTAIRGETSMARARSPSERNDRQGRRYAVTSRWQPSAPPMFL